MNKLERKNQIKGRVMITALLISGALSFAYPFFMDEHFPVKGAEKEVQVDKSCYLIEDVYELHEDYVDVIMADGSIQTFNMPEDAPYYFKEVCFYCENIDDFKTYKIVALR